MVLFSFIENRWDQREHTVFGFIFCFCILTQSTIEEFVLEDCVIASYLNVAYHSLRVLTSQAKLQSSKRPRSQIFAY